MGRSSGPEAPTTAPPESPLCRTQCGAMAWSYGVHGQRYSRAVERPGTVGVPANQGRQNGHDLDSRAELGGVSLASSVLQ